MFRDTCLYGRNFSSELLRFWTLSIFQYSKKLNNTTFRKLDLIPSSGQGGKTPSQLGPLEKANLNHLPDLRTETDPVSETLCSLIF
jgi:hypothetical protein